MAQVILKAVHFPRSASTEVFPTLDSAVISQYLVEAFELVGLK